MKLLLVEDEKQLSEALQQILIKNKLLSWYANLFKLIVNIVVKHK